MGSTRHFSTDVLNRLGKSQDAFAAEHAAQQLDQHPEETLHILGYLGKVPVPENVVEGIGAYAASDAGAVYPFQQYEILDWLSRRDALPIASVMHMARRFAIESNTPHQYLRSVSRRLLGKFGTPADLERLRATYQSLSDEIEQCEVLRNLYRMETNQRNSFAGRWNDASEFHRRTVRLVRSGAPLA